MAGSRRIAVLVGSLRAGSYNRMTAKLLISLAPASLSLAIVEIGDLPLYNADLDEADAAPPQWQRFRDRIRPLDGLLFVTPEYNRSVPGVLKNAIDVGSRPYGQNVFDGKPAAVISVSTGAVGGFGANHHLRQSLVFLNVPALPQPEAYIGGAAKRFTDDGALQDEGTGKFLATFIEAFAAWMERLA